jgi:predicted nuclease of restriction endonuclease-like (RecB) superfamily
MKVSSTEYPQFLASLKATIRERQYQALRAVNHELLALYLEIGEAIYRKQEDLGWGKAVVETLAHDLQAEFPGRNGFSAQNLWLMRQFYREYLDLPKLQPLVREISWAKNLVILAPVESSHRFRAAPQGLIPRCALQKREKCNPWKISTGSTS